MGSQDCFAALSRLRTARSAANAAKPVDQSQYKHLDPAVRQLVQLPISGADVARQYSNSAASQLPRDKYQQLMRFLGNLVPNQSLDTEQRLQQELAEFKNREVQLSGQPLSRLADPSGCTNAEVGLILHCQSKEGEIGPFWDLGNDTIRAFEKKGIDVASIFGFDWHWRAEDSLKGRGNCSAAKWPPALKKLHDEWSARVLELLPLPFLVIAGKCTELSYMETLSQDFEVLGPVFGMRPKIITWRKRGEHMVTEVIRLIL